MTPLLQLENIHKHFGAHHVLRGIDLEVSASETVVIIGASGSGKSTLLRCVNFLELPDSGRIRFKGEAVGKSVRTRGEDKLVFKERELCRLRRHIGMVFQQFNLFPHMTVLENVMEGLVSVLKLPKPEARERALGNLEKVGLTEKAEQHASRLSGGSSRESLSPARSPCSPMSCFSTRLPRRWTRSLWARSCRSCETSAKPA